jgi:hypothetical protein
MWHVQRWEILYMSFQYKPELSGVEVEMAFEKLQKLPGSWTSAVKQKRTVLFWVITRRVVVISYQHFGTTYWSYLHGFLDP